MTLHLHHLRVSTRTQVLVEVADVRLERGRPTTIVGESGSGKSLLGHSLMGTLPANLAVKGRMSLLGEEHDLERRDHRRLWGRLLALLPQEPALALDPTMRVGAQVAEGAATFPSDRAGARRAASRLLGGLGLGGEVRAYPHTLSGGMAQRVAFAAATVGGADVLIADEPSKGLDRPARDGLARLLRQHVEDGGVLLTITHDLDLARALGGDVLVMREAAIVERGPAQRLLAAPEHAYTRRLLAAEPANWAGAWARGAVPGGEPLVSGTGLTKSFGSKVLFDDLHVTINAGDRLALHGPSGSGKTTLGNILLRLLRPDAGQVHHVERLAGGRLQKLYQDPALAFPARVPLRAALADVVRRHGCDPARPAELLTALRLPASLLDRRPGQVSGGELQRLAIIRAMLLDPVLLFADEPTSRLDLITQEETVRCLMEQVDASGCALVLVTHDAQLAAAVADSRLELTSAASMAA